MATHKERRVKLKSMSTEEIKGFIAEFGDSWVNIEGPDDNERKKNIRRLLREAEKNPRKFDELLGLPVEEDRHAQRAAEKHEFDRRSSDANVSRANTAKWALTISIIAIVIAIGSFVISIVQCSASA